MTTRRIALARKSISSDTGWKTGNLPPRHAPVFSKSKPHRPGWEWRSLRILDDDGNVYICLFEISPNFGKWNSRLIAKCDDGSWAVLIRLEDQPGKSGLHVHANCYGERLYGAESMNMPERIPQHDSLHRRQTAWTKHSFFFAAVSILRIHDPSASQAELGL